jgi:hypothetical protein
MDRARRPESLPSADRHEVVQRQSLGADVLEDFDEPVRIRSLALRCPDRPRRRRALLASGERQAENECRRKGDGEAGSSISTEVTPAVMPPF